ncbi:MAG: diol dehydratase small subunit, partial [Chloroflexi bacterium]|nr:diol dehydratase small subunit [Chloroflexota bacterium]
MSQQDIIAAIVKEVLAELNGGNGQAAAAPAANGRSLNYKTDYPLAQKRRELVKTATGKTLDDITLDAIMSGAVKAEEIRITPQTLEYQAQIAESISRPQLARNMRRAGELTNVPDERVLGMYNALRPNRSSKAELLAIA